MLTCVARDSTAPVSRSVSFVTTSLNHTVPLKIQCVESVIVFAGDVVRVARVVRTEGCKKNGVLVGIRVFPVWHR